MIAEYKYDIYGRRMQKNVNGTITNFLWEGDNLAYELDENFDPIRRYVYGMGKDEVKGHVEFAEAQNNVFEEAGLGWYSYIKDQVGSITQVYSRENYSMAETRTYDVFGNLINKTGSSNGNLGFQGKYFDQESGLYYYYHRYYYPTIGRFINEDPIGFGGGNNFFSIGRNNPLNFNDFWGLQSDFLPSDIRRLQSLQQKSSVPIVPYNGKLCYLLKTCYFPLYIPISQKTSMQSLGESIRKNLLNNFFIKNLCCLASCLGTDIDLVRELSASVALESVIYAIMISNPEILITVVAALKATGAATNILSLNQLANTIEKCLKICGVM